MTSRLQCSWAIRNLTRMKGHRVRMPAFLGPRGGLAGEMHRGGPLGTWVVCTLVCPGTCTKATGVECARCVRSAGGPELHLRASGRIAVEVGSRLPIRPFHGRLKLPCVEEGRSESKRAEGLSRNTPCAWSMLMAPCPWRHGHANKESQRVSNLSLNQSMRP